MRTIISCILIAGLCGAASADTGRSTLDTAETRCKAIASADFSRIPDAVTQVVEAKIVESDGANVGYCEVSGYIAPAVGFVARLPQANWNGKFIELGCGGWCGTTDHIVGCEDPLRRGYACIVSDGGHKGADGKWAYNNLPAEIDFAFRATHVTALAGKAIVERYYNQAPRKSYFNGCSRGGLEAISQAQRFPWDFDGIIAGAPAVTWPRQMVDRLWNRRAMLDPTGQPIFEKSHLDTLHEAVVVRCDLNDGLKDGLIGDPRTCDFDPSKLLCAVGKKTKCLTAEQVAAVKKMYRGAVTSQGMQIVPPSALRGSEQLWLDWYIGFGGNEAYAGEAFRYTFFYPDSGPTWKLDDFDFDRDYKRLGMATIWEPSPDLRKYKAAGGKLLMYMGWADVAAGGVLPTTDYYEAAEKLAGGRAATQEFMRLFMIPGMGHCGGGDGAFAVDWLSYLESWVEKGEAPEKLISAHVDLRDLKLDNPEHLKEMRRRLTFPLDPTRIVFSRPVYSYPTMAKYSGRGDSAAASSFQPIAKP